MDDSTESPTPPPTPANTAPSRPPACQLSSRARLRLGALFIMACLSQGKRREDPRRDAIQTGQTGPFLSSRSAPQTASPSPRLLPGLLAATQGISELRWSPEDDVQGPQCGHALTPANRCPAALWVSLGRQKARGAPPDKTATRWQHAQAKKPAAEEGAGRLGFPLPR
ncbi:hypothetical protein SKAU_G00323110 [Synaphobranchus kaupii]|uniref:Uncharacterized protein n=1 Tax=Synaphobranchus kaupii TaxID=118154 RepID=A0A9Q1EP25_SYNKA|nr:hypothetical protein SKAU_G00323110 [Synaphobranchus kaupii]